MDVVQPAVVVSGRTGQSTATWRHRVEYAGLRGVLAVAGWVGIDKLASTGAAIMGVVGPRLRQNRRALQNLAIAFPEKSEDELRTIARAMWANMGRTFAETLLLPRLAADGERICVRNEAHWQKEAAEQVPLVGCTLHAGNWEIAILPFKLFGRNPTGVYKPLENPLIDGWLADTRQEFYPGGLLGKGDNDEDRVGQRTARLLIDRARAGNALGFVCDHFDRRGEPIPFMGRVARFTTAPAMIARHVGARVWVGRAIRLGTASRFDLEIVEVPVPRTADKRADGIALTTEIFAVFEGWIREHPEQWMWWNTRWLPADPPSAAAPDGSA